MSLEFGSYSPRFIHPRVAWLKARMAQAQAVLAFVQLRSHGANGVRTYAVAAAAAVLAVPTQPAEHAAAPVGALTLSTSSEQAMDTLIDVIVHKYAPLPERSLAELIRPLRGGVPQWDGLRAAAFARQAAAGQRGSGQRGLLLVAGRVANVCTLRGQR